jgi:hypothetical protein
MDAMLRAWFWAASVPVLSVTCLFGPEFVANRPESQPPSRVLAAAEVQDAERALRASGEVERHVGMGKWSVDSEASTTYVFGSPNAVRVRVLFDPVVDASGTWRILRCQGTRIYEGKSSWTDVGRLGAVIDLESDTVISLGVAPGKGFPGPGGDHVPTFVEGSGSAARVFDLPSGQWIGEKPRSCPNGLEDD